jgi:hypothetical protein
MIDASGQPSTAVAPARSDQPETPQAPDAPQAPDTLHAPDEPNAPDALNALVARIAAGDRSAFRRLFAFLALPIWDATLRVLPDPPDARAVTGSVFVEVWHLARRRPGGDARTWLAAVTARRIADRLRAAGASCSLGTDHDHHVRLELAALLGTRPAIIRTGPRTFARVDDINLDFTAPPLPARAGYPDQPIPARAGAGRPAT